MVMKMNNFFNNRHSTNNDTIIHELVELLLKNGWHISFAESCTGGLAAAGIVGVEGTSEVFNSSFVTYSNESKIKYLGVNPDTIEEYGVVSEEVAEQMAIGTAKANNAEIGVGISGIAGPTGGSENKPVGTVCFGFYINGKTLTSTQKFGNIGRNNVRNAAVDYVYNKLIKELKDKEN